MGILLWVLSYPLPFVSGFLTVMGMVWLVFIYPYSDFSLKPSIYCYLVGALCAVITLLGICFSWYSVWPKD